MTVATRTVFDQSVWEKHFTLPEGVEFEEINDSLPEVDDEGFVELHLPKGITVDGLRLMVQDSSPQRGGIKFNWSKNYAEEKPVPRSYRVLITDDVIEKSRGETLDVQKALLEEKGARLPTAVEAVALTVLTFMESGKRIFPPFTYTSCQETFCDYPIVVGKHLETRLDITTRVCLQSEVDGVAAVYDVNKV